MKGRRKQNLAKRMIFHIGVEGLLEPYWSEWFDHMTVRPQEDGQTLLVGPVHDQAALHRLLAKIRDMGMPLQSVERLEAPTTKEEK